MPDGRGNQKKVGFLILIFGFFWDGWGNQKMVGFLKKKKCLLKYKHGFMGKIIKVSEMLVKTERNQKIIKFHSKNQ